MSNYSINELMERTGLSRNRINKMITLGRLHVNDGQVEEEDAEQLISEREQYIGLYEYAMMHSSDTFHGSDVKNRNNLRTLLEKQNFFGLSVIPAEDLLSGNSREKLYFNRNDLPVLEEKLSSFFWGYGMPEDEKVEYLISHAERHPETCRNLKEFFFITGKKATPSVTAFVEMMLQAPDLLKLKDSDIQFMLETQTVAASKDLLINFLSYSKKKNPVKYSTLVRQRQESVTIPAYADETYFGLAMVFFNAKYIDEHDLIRKALDDHTYCEMWLYLTLFYTCGWRAEDVCRGWAYPNWSINKAPFDISNLYDDILYDRIPDHIYEEVCDKAIRDINVANRLPGKTSAHNPRPLTMCISPYLRPFYGLLTLIAESHHLRTGEGYMKPARYISYQMNPRLRAFFGDEINQVLHGENIRSRRLNKDFLQGAEEHARRNGNGFLCSVVASYARNHTSLQSIRSYLQDHRMTGESAEIVLYCMMERGVFGIEYYQALVTAYPELIKELPIKHQNQLIAILKNAVAPLQAEMNLSGGLATENMKVLFQKGTEKDALSILDAMYEITQDRGKGKDEGLYCLRRARGEICNKPSYESCISACCDELIFTRYGYQPLLAVLLHYKKEAESGSEKAEIILHKILIPRYRNIINELMKHWEMPKNERLGLKKMLEETLNG